MWTSTKDVAKTKHRRYGLKYVILNTICISTPILPPLPGTNSAIRVNFKSTNTTFKK